MAAAGAARYPSVVTAEAIRHPTGAQHRISYGEQHATVVQVGGGLREYEVDGFPVVDGYGVDEMASVGRGQWDLRGAYKYVSEANAGYHFDVNHGLNIDAGIFVSYIGLFSYYNYDNWTYQQTFRRDCPACYLYH